MGPVLIVALRRGTRPSIWARQNRRATCSSRCATKKTMLSAVLLEAAGTLWPDRLAPSDRADGRVERLRVLLPSVDPHLTLEVQSRHMQRTSEPLEHDVVGAIRMALVELGLDPDRVATRAEGRARRRRWRVCAWHARVTLRRHSRKPRCLPARADCRVSEFAASR
jgi:hypothetical protein